MSPRSQMAYIVYANADENRKTTHVHSRIYAHYGGWSMPARDIYICLYRLIWIYEAVDEILAVRY